MHGKHTQRRSYLNDALVQASTVVVLRIVVSLVVIVHWWQTRHSPPCIFDNIRVLARWCEREAFI